MLYQNDVGNDVSGADGMKDIWRKYMEKLLNAENDWDGEVDCSEEEEVAAAIIINVNGIGNKLTELGVVMENNKV